MITIEASAKSKGLILYDGVCPLCQRSMAILKRLDWLEKLSYQDARDTVHLPELPETLPPGKLLEEMHVLPPDRRAIFAGFKAFRWIAGRIPLLWPLLPLMYLPGMPRLGQRAYLWVARNRFKLVPCHDGQCALPPRRR